MGPCALAGRDSQIRQDRLSQLAEELERVKSSSDARAKDEQQRITELIGTFPLLERLDQDAQEELLFSFARVRPHLASA